MIEDDNKFLLVMLKYPKEKKQKTSEKGSRSYSLGIMIVAITVGSQQAATRFPGFEAKAAGFSTCTLLGRKSKFSFLAEKIISNTIVNAHLPSPYSKIYGTVGMVDMT